MALYVHRVNTIEEAYRTYYQLGFKTIEIDVQITADNKVVVYHDDVHDKRLKYLKNTIPDLVTLEEFLHHTPKDLEVIVELKRYDDKDYAYRVVHQCKQYKTKKYIYASFDSKFAKHIQCMRLPVLHLHDTLETLDPYYKQVLVHKDCLPKEPSPQPPEALATYEGVYVWGVTTPTEQAALAASHPWVKGWVADPQKPVTLPDTLD